MLFFHSVRSKISNLVFSFPHKFFAMLPLCLNIRGRRELIFYFIIAQLLNIHIQLQPVHYFFRRRRHTHAHTKSCMKVACFTRQALVNLFAYHPNFLGRFFQTITNKREHKLAHSKYTCIAG